MAEMKCKGRLLWAGPYLTAIVMVLFFAGPAEGSLYAADGQQVAAANCARQLYKGLDHSASLDKCNDPFFIPTSASVKCGLYRDVGYPSNLMRKACQLYDRGVMEFFLEGASAEQ